MNNAYNADLCALIGASGSGKTTLAKKMLRERVARVPIIWSWKESLDHYAPEFGELVDGKPEQLAELVEAGRPVVYVPLRHKNPELVARQFDLYCRLVFDAGECAALVEEMAEVCTSRSAPLSWRRLVTEGRGRGVSLLALTQRPQLCDASLLDGATEIYCGRLQRGGSKKIMADALDVPLERVRGIKPLEFLYGRAGVDAVELVKVETVKKRAARRRRSS